jgi:hypothetical protein
MPFVFEDYGYALFPSLSAVLAIASEFEFRGLCFSRLAFQKPDKRSIP